MKIIGIDLAGKKENPSGIAILDGNIMKLVTSYSDNEILDLIYEFKPYVIVIDAPLSLPKGRCCLERIVNVQLEDIFVNLKGRYVNLDEHSP